MNISLPKISIITPSLNQAKYIEKTIQSVLSQKYPRLDYIVVDGGSTDGTMVIIEKYKKRIILIAEKDNGQSEAINKGLRQASGEIIGYLNSDDYLEENALFSVGRYFVRNKNVSWVTGKCKVVDNNGCEVEKIITFYKNFLLKYARNKSIFQIIQFISQPATFWRKKLVDEIGYFDQSLHYSMDYDYWLRIWQKYELGYINQYLASYRIHPTSKAYTAPQRQFHDSYRIIKRYNTSPRVLLLHKWHDAIALFIYHLLRR